MKVSEAIDRLKVGDTVWAKATVNAINFEGGYIRAENTKTSIYLDGNAEISLTEPQAEKVEAHLAEHWNEDVGDVLWWNFPVEEPPYCGTPLDERFPKYKTHFSMIDMPDEIEQPKRWVVKNKEHIGLESFVNSTINPVWTTEEPLWMTFTDRAKAEAVATLIDGEVEEVAE